MITTDRLILRKFTSEDVQGYAEIMAKKNVYQYLGSGNKLPKEIIPHMISQWNDTFVDGLGVYAVAEKETGKLVGHSGVRMLPCGRIEILYAFDDLVWGKGYATESAQVVLKHHTIRPLIAISYPENKSSINVIEKLGFERAGAEEFFGKQLEVFTLKEWD